MDVCGVVGDPGATRSVPVSLVCLTFFDDAANFRFHLDRVCCSLFFGFTPGVVSFLIDEVGTLAGQIELGLHLVFGDLGFAFDGECPALVERAVGLGLELFEERST